MGSKVGCTDYKLPINMKGNGVKETWWAKLCCFNDAPFP